MSKKFNRPVNAQAEAKAVARYRRPLLAGILFTAISGLAGCSSVPNAINPAEWYKSTVDFFAGEDGQGQVQEDETQNAEAKPIPGEEGAIPQLSSVPKRLNTPVLRGLVSDSQKREYAQPIARQGEAAQMMAQQAPAPAPQPGQASAVTAVQPAPPAVPASPVTSTPTAQVMPTSSSPTYASIQPKGIILTPPTSSAPALPANAMASITDDPYTTVVVSSNGVEIKNTSTVAAAPAPAPQMASISPVSVPGIQQSQAPSGTKIATILFQNGSAGLSRNDRRILGEVIRLHQQRGGTVTVVGHASSRTTNMDPVRHKMVNYGISVNRADKIARELRRMGLAPESIIVDARSDSMPLYYEIMPSGESGNRRAEIYFDN